MLFYDINIEFFLRNFNSMLPQIGTQLRHPEQLFQLFVFLLQLFVVNVLFHFGKVTNWCPSFFIPMQSPALVDPVKNGGISLDAINQLSLAFTEFAAQYLVNDLLLKGLRVE